MRRVLWIAATLVLLLPSATCGAAPSTPRNFGVVIPEGIYRGGQPTKSEMTYLRGLGVRTILKLNHGRLDEEREQAERLGMSFVSLPLDPTSVGEAASCAEVAAAVAILSDRSRWPVYVHCSRGRDRTGLVVGAYREIVEQVPWSSVDRELARYGHDSSMRLTYPQISRELRNQLPQCSDSIARALSRRATAVPE
ncbi:MAG: fused DSP-PTPase phosphatase/NAD kinase-like protein [Thermoanaerobaculia bacterium]